MTLEQTFHEVVTLLESHRDAERAASMEAYMKGQFKFYGISSPDRKVLMKPFHARLRKADIRQAFDLIDAFWNEGHRECKYIGMDLLDRKTKQLDAGDIDRIIRYILLDSWWDTVDHLAAHQIGFLFRQEAVRYEYLQDWLDSDNIWLNRTCLLFQMFYREATDWPLLQGIIHHLGHKNDFFIQKAIGWALRQYSKVNGPVVTDFVETADLSNLASREGLKWLNRNVK